MTHSNRYNGYSALDDRTLFTDASYNRGVGNSEDIRISETYSLLPTKLLMTFLVLFTVSLSAFALVSGNLKNAYLQQEKIKTLQNVTNLNLLEYLGEKMEKDKSNNNISSHIYDILENFTMENFSTVKFIDAYNRYGIFSAPYSWLINNPSWQLVEPFKETFIELIPPFISENTIKIWKIQKDGTINIFGGNSINLIFNQTGNYTLSIFKFNKKMKLIETLSTLLICKYVKRELRSLLPEDKQQFLEAMSKIWSYSNEVGRQKYGSTFTSITTFIEEHAIASGDILCDQFHEGSGFLTHHLAIQNAFEVSLRAVNPAVTTHYWDFTIEGELITNAKKTPSYLLEVSTVFTDAWFGSVDENHHIQDSLFTNMKMPKATKSSNIQNSYGYVRSYWNNNPDERVQRCLFSVCGVEPINKKIPDCSHHFDVLNTSNLGKFLLLSPSSGHGPMHVHTGGIWGECEAAYQSFSEKWGYLLDADITDDDIYSYGYQPQIWTYGYSGARRKFIELVFFGEYFHIYRSLWRSHMCAEDRMPGALECPERCDNSEPPVREDCRCHITALMNGTKNYTNYMRCFFMNEVTRELVTKLLPVELITDLMVLMSESVINEGDMLESASPADVIFWVIHVTIERLLSAKRLPSVTALGNRTFGKWTTEDQSWLSYSYYNLKKGSNAFHPEKYTCIGHEADDAALPDALHFTDIIRTTADRDGNGVISNVELFHALDPNNMDTNDYVFDHFHWNHCDA